MYLDIQKVITKLQDKRKIYVSEADFQLEMGWVIKELHPEANVRLEYCPDFDPNMHIDILVIIKNKWIPIELKYKTKGCRKKIENEIYNLKNHSAKDVNCYAYLKDIQRIEKIKNNKDAFQEGYAIFLTNDLGYLKPPVKLDCIYKDFSLEEGIRKVGTLDWAENASEGTKKNCEEPITLENEYVIEWQDYSKLDDTSTGTFKILVSKIKK